MESINAIQKEKVRQPEVHLPISVDCPPLSHREQLGRSRYEGGGGGGCFVA